MRDLRMGVFDVLVGINLLREGLDIPECGLVAILDADKLDNNIDKFRFKNDNEPNIIDINFIPTTINSVNNLNDKFDKIQEYYTNKRTEFIQKENLLRE